MHKQVNRQVHLGNGQYTYALHGDRDLLPGGGHRFTKADLPPSYLLKFDNDKKSGIQPSKRAMPTRSMTLFSSDEMYAMFGMPRTNSVVHKRRSIDITREAHIKAEKEAEEAAYAALFGDKIETHFTHASGAHTERWSRTQTELSDNTLMQLAMEAEARRLQEMNAANDAEAEAEDTERTTTVRLRSGPGSMISAPSASGSMRSPRSSSMPQSARSPSVRSPSIRSPSESSISRASVPQSARGMTRTASDSGLVRSDKGGSPAGSMLSARSSSLTASAAALQAALAQAAASPARRDSSTGRIMWRSNSSPALNKRPS